MADYPDIAVRGSVDNVRNLATQAFAADKFRVTWESQVKGKAERGSKGMNIAFGALAQHDAMDSRSLLVPTAPSCALPVRERLVGRNAGTNEGQGPMEPNRERDVLLVPTARPSHRRECREGVRAVTVRTRVRHSTRCGRSCSKATGPSAW